jgi:hypothetical protein
LPVISGAAIYACYCFRFLLQFYENIQRKFAAGGERMAELKYAKQVLKEPRSQLERDGKVIFDGILAKYELTGVKCQMLYSIVSRAHINEAIPHIHDFPIMMSFIGTNPLNIYDFDAEIEFYIGGEKQVITSTSVVSVPAGVAHCPLIFKRIGKPLAFLEIMLTDHYARREPDK